MNRVIHFVGHTLSRRDRRGRPGTGGTNAGSTHDLDPLNSYARVLEEARERRGRLFSRF